MKFEGQNIIFNKVLSSRSLFQDMDLGEMGPDFQSTVWFSKDVKETEFKKPRRFCKCFAVKIRFTTDKVTANFSSFSLSDIY